MGRRKQAVETAPQGAVSDSRALHGGSAEAAPEGEDIASAKRVQVVHYKVFTSVGRLIAGQFESLPAKEADALIAEGKAKECK